METPYYTENNNVGVNSSRVVLTRAASAKYESNISLPASDRACGHFAGIRCVSGISGDAESQMVPSSEEPLQILLNKKALQMWLYRRAPGALRSFGRFETKVRAGTPDILRGDRPRGSKRGAFDPGEKGSLK